MKLPLQSFRLKNFKAVQDSGAVPFTPLTVLIGNNGSGKSSLIEGLESLWTFAGQGLNRALQQWHGLEHVRNKAKRKQRKTREGDVSTKAVEFVLRGHANGQPYTSLTRLNDLRADNRVCVESELLQRGRGWRVTRDMDGRVVGSESGKARADESILGRYLDEFLAGWQFLNMAVQHMGEPTPQTRTRGAIRLAKDGRNIAEYLLEIFEEDRSAFDSIVDTMQWVLPYSRGLQADITSELERSVYLQMSEGEFKVPGWLLSTGTLRILALLAVLRHPTPPPLLIVEELENGLDPRTIHLVLDEIRSAVQEGRTQVIATTHSPYLLDRLPLQTVVLVERENGGQPVFWRPSSSREVQQWTSRFAPGQLYTAGQLKREARP